jgi:hypothetical protein
VIKVIMLLSVIGHIPSLKSVQSVHEPVVVVVGLGVFVVGLAVGLDVIQSS